MIDCEFVFYDNPRPYKVFEYSLPVIPRAGDVIGLPNCPDDPQWGNGYLFDDAGNVCKDHAIVRDVIWRLPTDDEGLCVQVMCDLVWEKEPKSRRRKRKAST